MTIAEWIESRGRAVPAAFRPYLNAEGPVSLGALIGAAEVELHACAGGASGDRAAAFSLLAADAYVSYACLWALTEGDAGDLGLVAERIVRAWTPGEPE